jgi:hypothetical protein
MYQPCPSSGQPTGPWRPATPAPVRTAVKLMYAGAVVSMVPLIVALAYRGARPQARSSSSRAWCGFSRRHTPWRSAGP